MGPAELPPLLLPSPRRLDLLGGLASIGGAPTVAVDPRLPPEGYRLRLDADGVRLDHADAAGRRHGLATLAQLVAQYGANPPEMEIEDAPAFPVRGVMLDVSRDRVPTMDHLLAMVERLASWKINHLQLYTEHTFAYAGHEAVWRSSSPFTPDEIRALDIRCRELGVDLAANQNCLGHLEHWFREPRYAALAEIASGQTWDFGGIVTKIGPFSLCPSDPGALALIEDLLGQLLPCFTSPLVNLGCDEAYDLGQGRSRDEVARRGRATVYLEWVAKVCAIARKHGKKPLFWADIALEHPAALARLPDGLVGLAWGYEPDAPFARWCEALRSAGREVWVCPGTSAWKSITGRTTERRANLLAAARDGLGHGATGYLVTEWGDAGHRQQWPVTLHALAEGAHRAWAGTAPFDPRASSLHAFADRTLALGPWLDDLGDVDLELRQRGGKPGPDGIPRPLRNASALFTDLHQPWDEAWVGTAADWSGVAAKLMALAEPHRHGAMLRGLDPRLARELLHTVRVALLASARAELRRGDTGPADRPVLASALESIIAEHRDLWLARSRPGGLDDSCRHYAEVGKDLASAG